MKEKDLHKRNASPVVQERDQRLADEANEWARHHVRRFFDANKEWFYLPSDILVRLDEDDSAPPAWLRWLSDYPTRYQMVRNACVSLAKRGYLESRQEKNALGKDATAYRRERDLDTWSVAIQGGDEQAVRDLLIDWLRSQPKALKGVTTITIARRMSDPTDPR